MPVASPWGQRKVPQHYGENNDNPGIQRSPGIYIGVVKKNDDPQKMGRLKVYIKEWGGDPEDEQTWITVSYASPFAGSTSIFDQGENVKKYEDTIKSYGWWAVPPDVDTHVLVAYAAGKLDVGYWFACLYQRGTQVTVPGIPYRETYDGENLPAAPKNRKDLDPNLEKYVTHKPLHDALKKQGLLKDYLRGQSTSSATRESPSRVLGLLTPGQHQFILDDGDQQGNDKLIRLRTTNGTQLLLDDSEGHIYLITKNGENWVELSADGGIHIYGSQDISIRSEANINLYADQDINMEAGSTINLKSNVGSINLQSGNEVNTLATTSTQITSGTTSNISSLIAHYETAAMIHMNGPFAARAQPIDQYFLVVNQNTKYSVCSTVPEHEPWSGHSGGWNPVGPGNQQMQEDPKPDQQPREPAANETPAPVQTSDSPNESSVPVSQATTSDKAVEAIKQNNGYSPTNTDDGKGQSGGFGSPLTNSDFGALNEANTESSPNTTEGTTAGPVSKKTNDTEHDSLNQKIFEEFDAKVEQSRQAAIVAIVAGNNLEDIKSLSKSDVSILTQGINISRAKELLSRDIKSNEQQVRNVLSNSGVQNVPQNVFDGLVSYQNQTGDISYAYVSGQKINLRGLYQKQDWTKVASFIAADDRDRPRRIQEAAMIAGNSYPRTVDETVLLNKGLNSTAESISKGNLNKQTGNPTTEQQLVATANAYFKQTNKLLPSQSFAFNKQITTSSSNKSIESRLGPFPY